MGVALLFSLPRTDATLAGFVIHEEAPSGLIFRASCVGLPVLNATASNTFAMGCILTDSTTGLAYLNQGTVASPSWVSVNETVPTVPPTTVVTAGVTVATTGDTDAYVVGDRIRFRAAATGTLAGALSNAQYLIRITT